MTQTNQSDIGELIGAALSDVGIALDSDSLDALVNGLEAIAEVRARFHLVSVLSRLPTTPGGESIFRFLVQDEESVASAAKRVGCSQPGLAKSEKRLRRFLGLPPKKPLVIKSLTSEKKTRIVNKLEVASA